MYFKYIIFPDRIQHSAPSLCETSLLSIPQVSFLFHSTYISDVYMYECAYMCVSVTVSVYVCTYSIMSLYNI